MNLPIARGVADNSNSNGLQGLNKKCLKFLEARKFPSSKLEGFSIVVDTKFTLESK